MLREPTDAEREEFAPVVGALLQALLSGLERSADGIEHRLVTDAASCLRPSHGKNKLAVGEPYDEWARRLKLTTTASVRPAFKRLADAAAKLGTAADAQTATATVPASSEKALRASFSRVVSTASGRNVHGTLTVVRPGGQKEGAAGFEVTVTLDGEDIGERTEGGALKKRETKATSERKAAIEAVASSLARNDSFREAVAALEPETMPRKTRTLYAFGRLAVILRVRPLRKNNAALFLILFLAGSALAFPEVREAIREGVAAVRAFVTGVGRRPAPPATPTPPSPTPVPPFETTITADYRPGPLTAPKGAHDFTLNKVDGDPTELETTPRHAGTQPWLAVVRTEACSSCVAVLAYPALRETQPLRFRVDFGDGSPIATFDTIGARVATGGRRVRASGVFFLGDPGWEQVFLLNAAHSYPVEDAPYVVTVTVEPIAAGAPAPIVTLSRKIRIEPLGVVSTDATITLPTPAPASP